MRIAHITDLHLNDFLSERYGVDTFGNCLKVLRRIKSGGFSRLLVTGDLGSEKMYPELIKQLESLGLPCSCVLGNHDDLGRLRDTELLERRNIRQDGYYYSETIGGETFLFLDSSSGRIGPQQRSWIRGEMEKPGKERVFVVVHHPLLDCGTAMDKTLTMEGRGTLLSLLEETQRDIHIFCGHYHFAHFLAERRIRQYVTPAQVMQIRSEGGGILLDSFDFGYRSIEIGDKVETAVEMFAPASQ